MKTRTFWAVCLLALGGAAVFRPAGAACPSFDPEELRPGMTLAEARRVLDMEVDGPEVAAVGAGFETTAHFRKAPARVALIFPGKVTARSKVGLATVRTCVPISTFDVPTFASRLRERYGEPTSGAATLDAGLANGEASWSDPACPIDVRAYRKGDWYDPASGAWCVEQRAARAVAPTAPVAQTPASAPASVPSAFIEPAVEPAVELPVEIVKQAEPLPQPPPAPAPAPVEAAGSATAPVLVASVPPRYPESLRQRRLKARVVVRAMVERDGSVGAVEVVETDRPGFGLEARVIAAVRQWRYKPGTQQGTPVASEIQIPFEFE